MAAAFARCSASYSDLFEFFHPSLLDGRSVVVNWTCHHRLLVVIGHIRGKRHALPYTARPFFFNYRIFHLDRRKYCYVLWRLAIPESSGYMEFCSSWKSKFLVFISHCKLSHRCDVKVGERKIPQTTMMAIRIRQISEQ